MSSLPSCGSCSMPRGFVVGSLARIRGGGGAAGIARCGCGNLRIGFLRMRGSDSASEEQQGNERANGRLDHLPTGCGPMRNADSANLRMTSAYFYLGPAGPVSRPSVFF